MTFNRDLQYGHTGETKVIQLLEFWNFKVTRPSGYFPDYDLQLNNGITIEIKDDRLIHKTGNFCLEIYALNKSKADVFAYIDRNTIYFSLLPPVRQLANQYPYKKQTGDQPDNVSALVPKRQYIELINPQIYTLEETETH